MTPANAVIGQPVQLEIRTRSSYGPITQVDVMVRTTTGSERNEIGWIAKPRQGVDWVKLAPEGVYVRASQNNGPPKMIRYQPGDQNFRKHAIDDPGWTRFVTTVTPTKAAPIIEMRWYVLEWENDERLKSSADQAIQIFPPLSEN
jgi:hypothetical protein